MAAAGRLSQHIDSLLTHLLSSYDIPGLALVTVQHDSMLLAKGYGRRSIESEMPVDERTLFAIGSLTKAFTATALARLVDDHVLRWDDLVTTHLPHFQTSDPWVTAHLTLRDLLSMRTGMPGADAITFSESTAADILERLRSVEVGSFRTTHGEAGNTCYFLAGQVIEATSGIPWADYITRVILQPLGMDTTYTLSAAEQLEPNRAVPHYQDGDSVALGTWPDMDAQASVVPASGLASTAIDLGKWLRFLLQHGRVGNAQLVSEGALHETWKPHILLGPLYRPLFEPPSAELAAYGFGWVVREYQGTRVLEHGGAIGGFTAFSVLVPENRIGFALMTNLAIDSAVAPLLAIRLELLNLLLESERHLSDPAG